jgi:hypothetical protein
MPPTSFEHGVLVGVLLAFVAFAVGVLIAVAAAGT